MFNSVAGLAPSTPPQQHSADNSDPELLISLIFEQGLSNNTLFFHKSHPLRLFFCGFLEVVFGVCLPLSKQATLFAESLLQSYADNLMLDENFIYCNEFVKLIAYLFNKLYSD
jgi:hypothetical protein